MLHSSKSVPARLSNLSRPLESRLSDTSSRRFALALRKELRPLNFKFNKRQIELSKRWGTIVRFSRSALRGTRDCNKVVEALSLLKHGVSGRGSDSGERCYLRPAVVKGLKILRTIAASDYVYRRSVRIVCSFVRRLQILAVFAGSFPSFVIRLLGYRDAGEV